MRGKDAIITGPMVLEKVKQFANVKQISDFIPSNGWLGKWKLKENIKFLKMHDEKSSADQYGPDKWVQNVLPALLNGYDISYVYNADKTEILFKALR